MINEVRTKTKLRSCFTRLFKKKSQKVFFLGAGASKDAGYPLTKDLYDALKADHENSIIIANKDAWQKFSQVINNIKTNYPEFSECDNIEYLMTILSLTQHFHKGKSVPNSIVEIKDNKLSESNETVSTYEAAKNGFARCIEFTFARMDYDMSEDRFAYLKNLLRNKLKSGDIVITTNYDFLLERCLQKLDLWNVHDGYGFQVDFRYKDAGLKIKNNTKQIKRYNSKKSKVKILKLHGSVGWLNGDNKIVIDTSSMQQHISKYWEDENYSPDIQNMTSVAEKIIKPKLGVLELAKQLGNVSRACETMGYSLFTP